MKKQNATMMKHERGGIDLNVCCRNGNSVSCSVREIVDLAKEQGMDLIAITDRDNISVKDPVMANFPNLPEILSGCTYTCRFCPEEGLTRQISIVGLYPYGVCDGYNEQFPSENGMEYPTLSEVVDVIGDNLGIAVLPNLFQFELDAQEMHVLLREFCASVNGRPAAMETECIGNSEVQQKRLEHLADKYGLLRSVAGRSTAKGIEFARGEGVLFEQMWHVLDDYIMEAVQPFR